jgi:AcrR family transcriptional regulator
VRAAVLRAAVEELAEGGYGSFSFESVAQRAGVHKTTLYRRWGDRESLVLDAMLELGSKRVPIPDTGSLREDLIVFGKGIVASAKTPEVQAIVRAVASIGDLDAKLAQASRRFWRTRLDLDAQIVEHAIDRGEVSPDTDTHLVVEAFLAAIYFRLLLTGGRLDSRYVRQLAEFVAAGAGANQRNEP